MKGVRFNELRGNEAKAYAREHLEKVNVDYTTWEITYREPATGQRYMMDYLHPEVHGGGVPRLRPARSAERDERGVSS